MKSRVLFLLMIASMATAPAYAAFPSFQTADLASRFQEMKGKVEKVVKEWVDYYWAKPAEVPAQAPKKAMAPVASAPVKAKAALPLAKTAPPSPKVQKGPTLQSVRQVHEVMKNKSLLKVAKPGRVGTTKLAKSKEGVPVAEWTKLKATKRIPRLDIGTENLISREEFQIEPLRWELENPEELKRLAVPHQLSEKEGALVMGVIPSKVTAARALQANFRTVGQPIAKAAIDQIQYQLRETPEIKLLPYSPIPEETLKMVAALILFEKGNSCHIIMGLFNNLAEAPKTKMEATYHLGACADQLGMNQAAFDNLSKIVAAEDKEYGAQALTLLAKDLPLIYEKDFYQLIKGIKNFKGLLAEEAQNDVAYRSAKGAYRMGDFKASLSYADRVNSDSDLKDHARFLSALNSFSLNDKAGAYKKLQDLWDSLQSRKVQDSNIRALVSVNLARMQFAQKKYSQALENYLSVPKDHALWVQALIEQGWAQLAIEDYGGAIGNMYSLHSPYFKAVYQPESFVVRSIGYLNICQYGDAYKTLSWLEKDYRDWNARLNQYLTTKAQPLAVYATVKNYIRGKSTDDVDGVPYQVWRELGRRKDYLNLQASLNDKQDEAKRYEGVNEKIKAEKVGIRKDAEASKRRFDEVKAQLAKFTDPKNPTAEQLRSELLRNRDLTIAYRFKLAMLEQSRQGYLSFQKNSQAKLDAETATLSQRAGEVLLARAKSLQSDMGRILENNEFLRYEVFAGSGENIRYQVAGGDVGNISRVPAHIKPTKMMNWSFDGEYWADEIGSYRSSLQNVCPTSTTGKRETQEGDHAVNDVK